MKKRTTGAGFTLVEVMIAVGILVLSIIGMVSVITYTTTQNEINRENLLAMRAAEGKIEEMRRYAVPAIFARYSATGVTKTYLPPPLNALPGLYPGPDFSDLFDPKAPTYDPTYQRIRNATGTITFPWESSLTAPNAQGIPVTTPTAPILLKEDPADPDPIARDLNASGTIGDDPTLDYVILPATITIQWTGIKGKRSITYRYMFLKRN